MSRMQQKVSRRNRSSDNGRSQGNPAHPPFAVATGLALVLLAATPVTADETARFLMRPDSLPGNGANVLFILDTSEVMNTTLDARQPYDPSRTYPGHCRTDRVYWHRSAGEPPDCATDAWFELGALACDTARHTFASGAGRVTDLFAQYHSGRQRWHRITQSDRDAPVECAADRGRHGDGSDTAATYARDGDASRPWSREPGEEIGWGSWPLDHIHTIFTGNYLNWHYGPTGPVTRLQVLKGIASRLVAGLHGVNVGLMKFNAREGGAVVLPVAAIEDTRPALLAAIDSLEATGFAPIAETLYEAVQYFRGGPVDYGDPDGAADHGPIASVGAARQPGNAAAYRSPIEFSCQSNFVVLLTDGRPSEDRGTPGRVGALPGFPSTVGPACADAGHAGDGDCLPELAHYLYRSDLIPDLQGTQNVVTHVIGFDTDRPLLAETAARGGGRYLKAADADALAQALTHVVPSIDGLQAASALPAVAVSSFNRTQHHNDLFMTVFTPTTRTHWPGNLKKYRLRPADGVIVDADGNPAVDPTTGYFASTARSYWSPAPDGAHVSEGGAANRIPHPDQRRVFTYLANPELASPDNQVTRSNSAIDEVRLGIEFDAGTHRNEVIDFIRGWSARGLASGARGDMGDSLNARPAVVAYGPEPQDTVVFVATNHGFLHAVDASTGVEKWAFVPEEFLHRQIDLLLDDVTRHKLYALDGDLRVQVVGGSDGHVSSRDGDRVYLYFGMRRGGDIYYALDITNSDRPRLQWRLGPDQLPRIGQTWSPPVPTRIRIRDAEQNPDHSVLVFGGGYDASQDNLRPSTDLAGNALYIVDSVSGKLLWHGTNRGGSRDFPRLNRSIPAEIRVLDFTGNGYADRLYAADTGGQIWRFDIWNGESTSALVTGGVIAELGAAPHDDIAVEHNRRFYHAPDVALARSRESSFLHIGIGSGHRARPDSIANHDRFYALRDYTLFRRMTQAEYDMLIPTRDGDLVDITDTMTPHLPQGSRGWRLDLSDDGWRGEKVMAPSTTFNNEVFFTTFTPGSSGGSECLPASGTSRLYRVNLFTGAPVAGVDGAIDSNEPAADDRYVELTAPRPGEIAFVFPRPDEEGTDSSCVDDRCAPSVYACTGLLCFRPGFSNNPVRTYWYQEQVD